MVDDDDVIPMVTVTTTSSERVANETARKLVRSGIGAAVEPVTRPTPVAPPPPATPASADTTDGDGTGSATGAAADWPVATAGDPPTAPPAGGAGGDADEGGDGGGGTPTGFAVMVLAVDVHHACDVLDIEPPELGDLVGSAPTAQPWKRVLLVFAIAMVVIPTAAYFITYYLVSNSSP